MKKYCCLSILLCSLLGHCAAQEGNALLQKVRDKLNLVDNYTATGVMKTNISFLRVPQAEVTVYFRKPDKMKIRNDKGISFVPKGAVTISLNSIITGNNFTVVDGGTESLDNKQVRVLKLLPADENSNVILSTVYINEKAAVIVKAKTTTRDNGTYELHMQYGRFISYGLPDRVVFIFNTRDYKMPKGVTFDYGDARVQTPGADGNKDQRGQVEITYSSYLVNKGVSDDVFK